MSDTDTDASSEVDAEHVSRFTTVPARSGHISQCVGMKVMVWGGYQEQQSMDQRYLPATDLWVYNLELESWSCLTTEGDLPPGMSGCCSCLYKKYLFVIGGHSNAGNTNSIYKLDLATLNWSHVIVLGDLMSPRDKAVAWSHDKKIYVFGGFGVPSKDYLFEFGEFDLDPTLIGTSIRNRGWNNQLLVFDVQEETWSNPKCYGKVPQPRAAHGAAQVGDNVFIFGGRYLYDRLNDLHCLNLPTLRWSGELTVGSQVPCGRSWHTFTAVSDTLIFLYGGFTMEQEPLSDAWVLDVNTIQWTQLQVPDNRPRLWHTASLSHQQDIVIFGGCANDILDYTIQTKQTNDVICFRISPKSLQRICFDVVFDIRERTQKYWDSLPCYFKNMLENKMKYVDKNDDRNMISALKNNHGPTCAIT